MSRQLKYIRVRISKAHEEKVGDVLIMHASVVTNVFLDFFFSLMLNILTMLFYFMIVPRPF